MIEEGIENGKVRLPRHMMDNYSFQVDKNAGEKIIRNRSSFGRHQASSRQLSMNSIKDLNKSQDYEEDQLINNERNN